MRRTGRMREARERGLHQLSDLYRSRELDPGDKLRAARHREWLERRSPVT